MHEKNKGVKQLMHGLKYLCDLGTVDLDAQHGILRAAVYDEYTREYKEDFTKEHKAVMESFGWFWDTEFLPCWATSI